MRCFVLLRNRPSLFFFLRLRKTLRRHDSLDRVIAINARRRWAFIWAAATALHRFYFSHTEHRFCLFIYLFCFPSRFASLYTCSIETFYIDSFKSKLLKTFVHRTQFAVHLENSTETKLAAIWPRKLLRKTNSRANFQKLSVCITECSENLLYAW